MSLLPGIVIDCFVPCPRVTVGQWRKKLNSEIQEQTETRTGRSSASDKLYCNMQHNTKHTLQALFHYCHKLGQVPLRLGSGLMRMQGIWLQETSVGPGLTYGSSVCSCISQ